MQTTDLIKEIMSALKMLI